MREREETVLARRTQKSSTVLKSHCASLRLTVQVYKCSSGKYVVDVLVPQALKRDDLIFFA